MTDWYKIKKVRIRQNGVEKVVRPTVPATAISLDKSSISLKTVWQTEQLTATLTPADSTSSVSWSSSNTSIATVSSTWLVTCVTPWTCTITATTDNGLTATCSVSNGWIPWANTVAYYKFDWNLNDSSWNNRNLTWWSTFTYWTLNTWAKYVQLATSSSSYSTNIPFSYTSYTFSCWCQCGTVSTGSSSKIYVDVHAWGWTNYFPRILQDSSKITPVCSWIRNYSIAATQWTWYYFTVVNNSNKIYAYINWSLYYQINGYSSSSANLAINTAWDGWGWTSFSTNGKLSELILESDIWSSTKIIDYYNQTKWKYWL